MEKGKEVQRKTSQHSLYQTNFECTKMGDDTSSQQKKPSEMTNEEYVVYRRQNKKGNTVVCDRDQKMETVASMIDNVQSEDSNLQLEATSLFRNMLQITPDPPFKQVIDAGVVPRFVQFLNRKDLPQLQYEAVKILSIFAEKSKHINLIVEHGVVPRLVNLLHAPNESTRALAISTLGFIAGEPPEIRERVLENQALETLLAQFEKDNTEHILQIASWTLHQFCKGNPPLNYEMTSKVLHVLPRLLHSSNEEVMSNACRTLHCFSYGEFQDDFKPSVCRKLIDMLSHPSPSVILPALEIVANIAKDDEIITQYIIADLKAARELKKLLVGEYDNNIKMAALRTVTYITKKNCNHTQEVVSQGIINVLANLFTRSDDDIKTGVAWAISNVTCNGTPQDIKSVSEACIKPLCDMLDCPEQELVLNCIRGLDRILNLWQEELTDGISDDVFRYTKMIEDVGGLEKIVKLRNHGQGFVPGIARSILHNYWLDIYLREEGA